MMLLITYMALVESLSARGGTTFQPFWLRRTILIDGLCLKDHCAKHGLSYEAEQMRRRRAMLAAVEKP